MKNHYRLVAILQIIIKLTCILNLGFLHLIEPKITTSVTNALQNLQKNKNIYLKKLFDCNYSKKYTES